MAIFLLIAASLSWAGPKVAVVIDDFGLNYKSTPPDEEWAGLPHPLTWAVMPESPRTKKAASLAAEKKIEVILHYPFDPFQTLKLPKEKAAAEDLAKVAALLEKSLKQVPNAVGLNNHRSYRATPNAPLMREFMRLYKPKGLYFLDSMVHPRSVAYAEAKAAGIPAARNFVFLDTASVHDKEFCVKMLKRAVARARKEGEAVAIGHHYFRGTYECLKEEMPRHAAEGIEFVRASALAR